MKVVFLENEDGGWWFECAFTFKFALNLMTNNLPHCLLV